MFRSMTKMQTMGGHVIEIRAQITAPRVPIPCAIPAREDVSSKQVRHVVRDTKLAQSCSADCLLGKRPGMVLLRSCTPSIVCEMKRSQKVSFPAGVPQTRTPSAISCGMSSLVEFSRVILHMAEFLNNRRGTRNVGCAPHCPGPFMRV